MDSAGCWNTVPLLVLGEWSGVEVGDITSQFTLSGTYSKQTNILASDTGVLAKTSAASSCLLLGSVCFCVRWRGEDLDKEEVAEEEGGGEEEEEENNVNI